MKYLSEILKIIEPGTNGNTEAVKNYGNLLSEKLAQEGLFKEPEAFPSQQKFSPAPIR